MSDLGDLDQLLADLDESEKDVSKDAVIEKAGAAGHGEETLSDRLAAMQRQKAMMDALLASDGEDKADEDDSIDHAVLPGNSEPDAGVDDLDKLLGEASKILQAGTAEGSISARFHHDVEPEAPISPESRENESSPGSRPEPAEALSADAPSADADGVYGDDASIRQAGEGVGDPGGSGADGDDNYDDEFELEGSEEMESGVNAGISMHQIASKGGGEGSGEEDEYGEDDFDDDDDVPISREQSGGNLSNHLHRRESPDPPQAAASHQKSSAHLQYDSMTSGLNWQKLTIKPLRGRELINSKLAEALQIKREFSKREWDSFGIKDLGMNDYIKSGQCFFKPGDGMIAFQLSLLESDWMKAGSMQQRIYKVALQKLAKSLVMDIFNECIDAYDECKRQEAAIESERQRREAAGFHQPRTCDLRVAELKRQKLERKMKRQAELDRRDAEYVEKAKEMAVKRRQEIKESENHLAESKERVRKKREKRLQKFEEQKQALLESNRQRVIDVKKQTEQSKIEIQLYIKKHREEEERQRKHEKKEQEEREAYRQYQQEVAISSMRAFINRGKESKNATLAKSKEDLRAMKHSQEVFENSLRSNQKYMDKKTSHREDAKKRRLGAYVKDVLPIDSTQTGKAYTDALKLTSAIYFSPCDSGTLLPQTKKKVNSLTQTTYGPSNGKRQVKAHQVIATLQDAYNKFQRWRPEGVKSADLLAALNRFRLGAPQNQMERLAREFGIDPVDVLEMDDFVETGVAMFAIVAPDVLVMDVDGRRRSKSAEPMNYGQQSLVHLERTCVSALGVKDDICFTRSTSIQDDLATHLSASVKSQKAREREMLLLAQEALEIKKLRETNSKGEGTKSLQKNVQKNIDSSDSPTPVNSFMEPSPAPGQYPGAELQVINGSSTTQPAGPLGNLTGSSTSEVKHSASKSPFSFNKRVGASDSTPLSTALPGNSTDEAGGLKEGTGKGESDITESVAEPTPVDVPMSRVQRMKLLKQQNAASSSQVHNTTESGPGSGSPLPPRPVSRASALQCRPNTGGSSSSRPGSRQTPFREGDVVPTEVLDHQDTSNSIGIRSTNPPNVQDPIATSGMSRVQRLKMLQQQNNDHAAGQESALAGMQVESGNSVQQPVPVSEPSQFPGRRRDTNRNRPF